MDPPANVPSAREMGRILLEFCAVKDEVENLLALPALRFEMIVERVQIVFDSNLKFLDYFDGVTRPNLIHHFLALAIVSGHSVITTKFDYCIERALLEAAGGESKKDRILMIITKEDYTRFESTPDLASNRLVLAKIHGSKKNIITGADTSSSLVTTMAALGKDREAGKTFAIEPYKKPTVERLTKDRTLVVMGYSGSDDFDIGPLLLELSGLTGIIWIEHGTGQSQEKSKSGALLSEIEKRAGIPITIIRANTEELVQKTLWNYLLPKISAPSFESFPTSSAPQFREFARTVYKNNADMRKYQLTARLFYDLVQYDSVVRMFRTGLDLAKKAQDLQVESYFLGMAGLIYNARGDYDNALKNYTEALQIAEQLGDLNGKATRLNNIGMIYKARGDYDNALKNYTEALKIFEQLGDLSGKASLLNNIGKIYRANGDYDSALKNYTEALKIDEQLGGLKNKASFLSNIGIIYKTKGDYDNALKNYTEALQIDERLSDLKGKATRLSNIGSIYQAKGDYDNALETFNEAAEMNTTLGARQEFAQNKWWIATILKKQGKKREALLLAQEALALYQQLGLQKEIKQVEDFMTTLET